MQRVTGTRTFGINRGMTKMMVNRRAALFAAAVLVAGSAALAQTTSPTVFLDANGTATGFGSGTVAWDTSTTSDWNTDTTGVAAPTTWLQPGQTAGVDDFNIANFNGSGVLTANVTGTVDVGGINFNTIKSNNITGAGTLNFGSNDVTIANNVAASGQNILVPIIGSGSMTITYSSTGGQGDDMNILGDLTGFTGSLVVATDPQGSLNHLNYTQLAIGSDLGSGATVQLQAYSQLTTEIPSKNNITGLDQQPTFTLNAPITLNPANSANSQEWIGAANGGNFGTQYPSTAMQSIMILNGVISGGGPSNTLFFGYGNNGGRGTVVLNNNETYTGNTYIDLASNNGLVQMGVDNALPSGTVLSFGPNTANGSSTSGVSPLDLNGHVMTIAGLATTSTYTNNSASSTTAAEDSPIGNIYNTSSSAASIIIAGSANTTYKGDIGDADANVNPFNSMYPYKGNTTANTNISLTINGPGVLTLAPQVETPTSTVINYMSDEYSGNTVVNGGGLTLSGINVYGGIGTAPAVLTSTNQYYYTLSNSNNNVTIKSGATLSSAATVYNGASSTYVGGAAGTIELQSGSTFTPGGAGTTGVFLTNALTIDSGAAITFDLVNANQYDYLFVNTLNLDSAGTHTINVNVPVGDTASPGTYPLILTNGINYDGTNEFSLGSTPNNGDTFRLLPLSETGSALILQVLAPVLQWDPSGQGSNNVSGGTTPVIAEGGGTWNEGSTFLSLLDDSEVNWANNNPTYANYDVQFGNDSTQPGSTVHLGENVIVPGVLRFGPIQQGNNYIIANDSYSITLSHGMAVITSQADTKDGSGNVLTPSAEIDAPIVLTQSQTWEVDNGEALWVNGDVTENGPTPSYTLTITGTPGATTGGIVQFAGTGSSFGTLNVTAGAALLANMNGIGNALVTLNGGALEFGSSGTFTNTFNPSGTGGFGLGANSGVTATLAQNITSTGPMALVDNGNLILNGNISATSLTNQTLGTTTFNGTATFTGNITNTLTGGRVYFNGNTTANSITISGGTTLLAAGATDNFANGITLTANTLVVGSASDLGVTATNLTGNNITLNGGTLNLSGAGTIPNNISLGTNAQGGGTITGFSFTSPVTSSPITLSGVISGVGNVTMLGSDFTLSGANTFGPSGGPGGAGGSFGIGNTGTQAGTPMVIHATNATSFGTGAIVVNAAGATLDIETNVMANAIRGGSIVTKTGPGTLTLFGKTATGPSGGLGYILEQGAIELQSIYGLGGGTVSTGGTAQGALTIDPGTSLLADVGGTENLGTITLAGGTIARIADAANAADFSLSTFYTDSGGSTQTHNAALNVTASSTLDNQDQSTAGATRNLAIQMPITIGSGATLTLQSENIAGNYEQAATVLRGIANNSIYQNPLTLNSGATLVAAGTGDVDLGDVATGEPIIGQGAPGSDAVMQLGSHTFMNDTGAATQNQGTNDMTRLIVSGSGSAGLRIEAPMDATYTVPNGSGAPSLRTYDGTTGLTGVNTTGTASAGTTPAGYAAIGNAFTVLSPNRAAALSNSYTLFDGTVVTPSGTLTLAATDAAGATGLINAGPASISAVALALDNTAQSGGTLVYQIDGGGVTPTFQNFAGLTVERSNSSAAAVTAQLVNHTMLTPSLAITDGAILDIGSEAMAIDTAGAPELSQIAGYLKTGYDSGNWDGAGGIESSSIALQQGTSVGYALNSSLPTPFSIFGGQAVDNDAILVKYTWLGDLNLDGVVDSTDSNMMGKLGTVNPGWIGGDLNYDGVFNADDWSLFDLGAAAQTGRLTTSVPEPSALVLLAGAGLAMRRRRK